MTESPSTQDILAGVRHCRESFERGATRPVEWRKQQLLSLERMLNECEAEFCEALGKDLGKSPNEAWLTEVSFVGNVSRHTRKNLNRWSRTRRVHTPLFAMPGRSIIRPEPLGTVLIIAPWNYPLQLCLSPLVTTIAAGNCAVIKPSELAPATSSALARRVPEYLDGNCVRVVEGGVETASLLLEQPWDHIVFTGGDRVARIVMAAAAQHLSPVTLELGGKSPCIVLPDADLDIAARRIAWGRFTNAGQTCIAPDHVLTDAETRERLIPRLRTEIRSMFGEDPANSKDYGRIVNQAHFDRIMAMVEPGKVAIGGGADRSRLYIEPTVLSGVSADSPSMETEIFGPVLPVMEVRDLDDAIRFVRARPKPLAAYLFGRDKASLDRMVESVSAGSVCLNDVMIFMAVDELPFGGVGASGTGNYKGKSGFRRLSHDKAVLRRSLRPDWRMRYAPFTRGKIRWLRRLR